MKKNTKRLFSGLFAGALFLSGCGGTDSNSDNASGGGSGDNVLEVWTFTSEIEDIVNDYFLVDHPDLDFKINITTIPTEQFEQNLDPVLGTNNAPDVIAMESAFVKKYVESGKLADLAQFGLDEAAADTVDYVKDVGTTSDGELVALSWQTTPGATFYRASMAEELLGIDNPEDMQAAMSDYDKFLEVARQVKEASDGEVYMTASLHDILKPFLGQREQGWVVDNTLTLDPSLMDMLDVGRTMVDEGLTMNAEGQGEAWFAGMSGDEVFTYSLPTWGMHFWLDPNSTNTDTGESTSGDWRMIEGPTAWFWGGTWLGITETSDMQEEASQLIEYVTTNEDFLTRWAEDTGDVVSNMNVVNEIRDGFEMDLLGGQNHYDEFANAIENIDGSILTPYDQAIEGFWLDAALNPYANGEIDRDQAINAFKDMVQNAYPNITVER